MGSLELGGEVWDAAHALAPELAAPRASRPPSAHLLSADDKLRKAVAAADEAKSAVAAADLELQLARGAQLDAIRAVEDQGDIATLDRIFRLVQSPFETHDGDEAFAAPPPAEMCGLEVSCSS